MCILCNTFRDYATRACSISLNYTAYCALSMSVLTLSSCTHAVITVHDQGRGWKFIDHCCRMWENYRSRPIQQTPLKYGLLQIEGGRKWVQQRERLYNMLELEVVINLLFIRLL